MAQLGTLGTCLAQAAQESDSSLAALITTQKQTLEKAPKPPLQAVSNKPNRPRPAKKRPHQKRKPVSRKVSAAESSE